MKHQPEASRVVREDDVSLLYGVGVSMIHNLSFDSDTHSRSGAFAAITGCGTTLTEASLLLPRSIPRQTW